MKICMVLFVFFFSASGYAQDLPKEPGALAPSAHNAIIGFDGVLLGGWIGEHWVSAEDLQERKEYQASRIQGGEEYTVYSVAGSEGTGKGTAIHSSRLFGVIGEHARFFGFGDARLALNSDWNAMPRQAIALDTNHAAYRKILKDFLAQRGLPNATPQIMQLFKVDLDGDGADEVVIVAQNLVAHNVGTITWAADKPLSRAADIPNVAEKGMYSLILVRKIVDGKVREIPFYQFTASENRGLADAAWTPPLLHKVYQFADLDGDGTMEIVAGENSCKGFSYQVYAIKNGKAIKVLVNGAMWATAPDGALVTVEDARKTLQAWLDVHPLPPRPAVLSATHGEHMHGGEPYYLFSLEDNERYWLNFLVHKTTDELLYMMISDGEHPTTTIEPLDAWYARHY